MNAALKREFFVLKNNLFFLIYVAIFMVVAVLENCIDNEGTLFFTMLTVLIGCLYSTNTSTNETRYKFDKQVAALPIIPNHIVISKYIVSFIFSLFINVILFLIKQLLFVFHVSEQDMLPLIPFLLAFYSVCLIITGIGLIISFAFGGDKAVYFIMALFATVGFTIGFMSGYDENGILHFLFSVIDSPYLWLVFIGGLLIYIASLPISAKLYTHRIQK